MRCVECGKMIWFWQKTRVAGTSSALGEVYEGHEWCVKREDQTWTDRFIEDHM